MGRSIRLSTCVSILLGLVAIQAGVLYLFGQPPICTCGYVRVWEGVILGPGNSQHLTDWYTFSHIVHGLLFYALLAFFAPRLSIRIRILLALGIEIGWEVLENTPMVIQHYREQALAQGYTGDSIINSISDTFSMALGFIFAARVPVWGALVLGLALELFALYMVRDNLTLNVINLIHAFPALNAWQMGA